MRPCPAVQSMTCNYGYRILQPFVLVSLEQIFLANPHHPPCSAQYRHADDNFCPCSHHSSPFGTPAFGIPLTSPQSTLTPPHMRPQSTARQNPTTAGVSRRSAQNSASMAGPSKDLLRSQHLLPRSIGARSGRILSRRYMCIELHGPLLAVHHRRK